MKFWPIFTTSLRSLWGNKVRTFLTTLGIIIGISAVIAMLAVGQGAQAEILGQIQGLGANTINIVPVANFAGPTSRTQFETLLTSRLDAEVVDKLRNKVKYREIVAIAPEISGSFPVSYQDETRQYTIYGVDADYFEVYDVEMEAGNIIRESDNNNFRQVAVIGPDQVETLFGANIDPVGKTLKINGANYQIVGVTAAKNGEFDERILIPLNTAASRLIGDTDYSRLAVKVSEESLVDSTAQKIDDELTEYYRVTDPDKAPFTIVTSAEILSLVGDITGILTTLVASIASISLLVGGIGIMNIMLVSVTERTKEIGLRKAIGAKESAIMTQFLTEALLLTLTGGIIGIALGFLFAQLVYIFGDIPILYTVDSVILATSVSTLIGVLFGFYPAYQAAKLNPIDALRYE